MDSKDVLIEAFGRLDGLVDAAVEGLSEEQLAWRVSATGNSIAWLVWHLTRIQDDHLAGVIGTDQLWPAAGWQERFGLPFDPQATGYGHSSEDVEQVRGISADLLAGYFHAVNRATKSFLTDITPAGLDRVVDERWDPPVTMGVRLVSVLSDALQHVGQAAYVRGLIRAGSSES